MYSVYTPSVGVVELAEYFCTHPCLIFTKEDPDFIPEDVELGFRSAPNLACDYGRPQEASMAQDSEDFFVLHILVWVIVVVLAIVALHCPLPRRVER